MVLLGNLGSVIKQLRERGTEETMQETDKGIKR